MSSISADGATEAVFLFENDGSTFYRINNASPIQVNWPVTITNTNPGNSSILKILFETNITLNGLLEFFVCGSSHLQFGSTSLNSDGTRKNIIIDGVTAYAGLIQNGILGTSGKTYIYIYNLNVEANNNSTLADGAGWIGQSAFGNGASNNFIVNCSSNGDIATNGGGIVGQAAGGESGASLNIIGCSTYGSISAGAGGITGYAAGGTGGSVTCEQCWSEGAIQGQDAGGIFGSYAGNYSGYALALKCYSTGLIANDAGGIFGGYAGENTGEAYAQKCYSNGNNEGNGGGIFSRYAGYLSGTTNASNCYSSGSLNVSAYGIYGVNQQSGATQANCYVANGSWSDSAANAALDGDPGSSTVGNTWVRIQTNTPYELNGFGATPYSINNINSSAGLIQNYRQTITAGESSIQGLQADASGNAFSILQISGGDAGSYSTLTISAQTGAISTTTNTVPGTYVFVVRNIGSYFITTFTLILLAADANTNAQASCCFSEIQERGLDYRWMNDYRIGNRLIVEHSQNPNLKFSGYSEYVKYKMAQNTRK